MPKPDIFQLLVDSALQPELQRRLAETPDSVFDDYDLTPDERDLLRLERGQVPWGFLQRKAGLLQLVGFRCSLQLSHLGTTDLIEHFRPVPWDYRILFNDHIDAAAYEWGALDRSIPNTCPRALRWGSGILESLSRWGSSSWCRAA